jgi:hypothetical protein
MNKKDLSERDICSKFIGPAVKRARSGREMRSVSRFTFTKGASSFGESCDSWESQACRLHIQSSAAASDLWLIIIRFMV